VVDTMFTDARFNAGAGHMVTGEVYGDEEFLHMNADFGEHLVRRWLERARAVAAP
jgi:hypothetical protein